MTNGFKLIAGTVLVGQHHQGGVYLLPRLCGIEEALSQADNAQAQAANNAANIDYLAMMSGIDLDDDTEVDDGTL